MARALVVALRARGADIRTVVEAGVQGKDDRSQLEWAAAHGRAIYGERLLANYVYDMCIMVP